MNKKRLKKHKQRGMTRRNRSGKKPKPKVSIKKN